MKFLALLPVLPLATAGVVANAPKEQLEAKSGKPGAVRKLFTLSHTINLAPGGGQIRGMGSGETFTVLGSQLCGECTVLEGQIKLTNAADDSAVDEKVVYNHHILTNGPRLSFPLKAAGMSMPMAGGFVGAGGDNGHSAFMYYNPEQPKTLITGYQMKPTTSFSTQVVLVNKSQKQQSIKVNYELEYIPGTVGKNVRSALVTASVMPKADGQSTSSVLTWEEDGQFLYGKGHLHDGGVYMKMWFWHAGESTRDRSKAYYTCDSSATYSGTSIVDMKSCAPTMVKKGDQVIMESSYSKAKASNAAAGGNMAMFRMIFAA